MKKSIFFSIVLTMLLFLGIFGIVDAKAETSNSFDFTIDGGLTGENNSFTLTSSKGIAYTRVSNVDLTSDVYVSIKFASKSVTNLDVFAYDGATNSYTEAAYKVTTDNKYDNLVEFQSYHDGEFTICTVDITDEVSAITEITYIKYVFRGATDDTLDILDFVITTDGVHGFDTSSSAGGDVEQPVEPETPTENDYNFVVDKGATEENGVLTFTSDKAYVTTQVSNVDLSQALFISIKIAGVSNLDVRVTGKDANGEVVSSDIVYKLATDAWNKTEYEVYGENDFIIMSATTGGYLVNGADGFVGIVDLTSITLILRGSTGTVAEILDFAITTDGVHGFDTTVSTPEEPEQPVEPETPTETAYNFVAGSGVTGENNVFTLTSSYGNVTTAVSNVDLSQSLIISVKIAGITNMDIHVTGKDANGQEITEEIVYKLATDAWNKTEYEVYGDNEFIIMSATTGGYLINGASGFVGIVELTSITLELRGSTGTVAEILDFAITTDGVHGFDTTVSEPEEPVEPEETPVFNVTEVVGATSNENLYTMTSTRTSIYVEGFKNVGVDAVYVSIKFIMNNVENFDIKFVGYNAAGELVEGTGVAGISLTNKPWNATELTNYEEYAVVTAYIHSEMAKSEIVELVKVCIYIRGAEGSTYELIDLVVTADGKHGFELPMSMSEPKSDGLSSIEKTEEGYEFNYNNDTPGWHSATIEFNNYKPIYDVLNIQLYVNPNASIGIYLHYGTDKVKLIDHWSSKSVFAEGGLINLSYSLEDLGIKNATLTKIVFYLDCDTDYTTNTGDQTVKLLKLQLVNMESIIAAEKEAAKAEVIAAIGTYEIDSTNYVAAIEAATTLELIAAAKEAALVEIETTIASIEAAKKLEKAKNSSILMLEEFIIGYEEYINITEYVAQIEAATTEEEVKSIFNAARAYVLDKIDEVDAANSLNKAKADAKKELALYKEASDYREAEQAQLAAAIEAGNVAIEAAETEAIVAEVLAAAKTTIDALKTKAQYEAEEAEAAVKALAAAKEAAVAELASYKAAADYREAEQAQLAAAIEAGNTAINAAATEVAVAEALAAAKTTIDALKTKAQYEAEEAEAAAQALAAAKTNAIAQIVAAIGSYAIDKATYESSINAATSVEAVATALESALADIQTKKAAIDEQNKPSENPGETPSDDPQAPASKGCFGSLVPSILGMVTLLGACIVVKRRKEE